VRLATFAVGDRVSYGIVQDRGVIDAGARLGARLPDLVAVLAAGAMGDVEDLSASTRVDYALGDIRLLKPLLKPGKILCVGVNYLGRSEEYKDGAERPKYPSLFVRFPASLVAHGEPIVRPPESTQLDYEGEIAVIIGRGGRRITEADALAHVAGYTVCNEGTVRDWTKHGKFNATAGKNFERSGALGPYLVTADEISSGPLRVITRVNGDVRQDETTDRMMFPIPMLISYITRFCPLEPGDIIVSGTPTGAGVRFDPPRYLMPGDRVEVEVPQVGTLINEVVDEVPAGVTAC
jgi:2-keto-4-pentenoate hydratase/2-oxohepta-3-ene-1,7-dioic acid hydratase in catechol pathway